MKRLDVLPLFDINIVKGEELLKLLLANDVLQLLYAFDCKIA